MREVFFSVSGTIQAKQRPRLGKHGVYTPKETKNCEKAVAWHAKTAMIGRDPFTRYIVLDIQFIEAIPPSWSKKKRQEALAGDLFPKRGDCDNKIKTIADALNGIVYLDDSQIVKITATKSYGTTDINLIYIKEISNSKELGDQ